MADLLALYRNDIPFVIDEQREIANSSLVTCIAYVNAFLF